MLKKYLPHYRVNLKLAYPVMLSQAGQMLVGIADSIMVGQIGALPLASCALANAVFTLIMVFGMGITMAITPLVGNAYGSGDLSKVGMLYRHGLLGSLVLGLVLSGLAVFAAPLLYQMEQPESLVENAIPYFDLLNLSLIPLLLFFNGKQFAEGVSSTRPAMFITLGCNALNVLLNYLFIYGHWGFAEYGLMGAGYATLISRIAMALVMLIWVRRSKLMKPFFDAIGEKMAWSMQLFKEILKLGLPIGGQITMEVAAFSVGALMIGAVGAKALAAHQIAIGMAALTYMMANGLSASATIRMSNFSGKKDYQNLEMAALSSFHLVIGFMSITAVIFVIGRFWLPSLYINDEEVITITAKLMVVAAFFQLFDGIQVTALGALRGIKDVRFPTAIALISYWMLALPSSYFYAFVLNLGAVGVWYGYLTGLGTAALLLTLRLQWLLKKMKNSHISIVTPEVSVPAR